MATAVNWDHFFQTLGSLITNKWDENCYFSELKYFEILFEVISAKNKCIAHLQIINIKTEEQLEEIVSTF